VVSAVSTAIRLLLALASGEPYPLRGIEDTEFNRGLWCEIGADLLVMEHDGIVPDVPGEMP
jgi:hypothetical protein